MVETLAVILIMGLAAIILMLPSIAAQWWHSEDSPRSSNEDADDEQPGSR